MMLLTELLAGLATEVIETAIADIAMDSRKVKLGSLFFSLIKDVEQREKHLKQALELGAAVVLFDDNDVLTANEQQLIRQFSVKVYSVVDLAGNVSAIAARFYNEPSKHIQVFAVTGTNGKTSVSHFIAQALNHLGFNCAVVGTLGVGSIDSLIDTGMTTPDPVTLQSIFASFYKQGFSHVVMEASSHALEQGRLNQVDVDVAIFTNLSRDHLDYHQDMQAYGQAKQKLFEFDSLKYAVINQQDEFGQKLISHLHNSQFKLSTYGSLTSDVIATDIDDEQPGLVFNLNSAGQTSEVNSALLGQFNIDNLLATFTALTVIGIEFDDAITAIASCKAVYGRMQNYHQHGQPNVVVDYAHTPDALVKALTSLRQHLSMQGQLWCVFGCGGDRDKGKRPQMGQLAEQNADRLVLTADNPRSENNEAIVADILRGISQPEQVHIEHNRSTAIKYAISHASHNDLVLVAGKGHESYQDIAGVKHTFTDAQAVLTAFEAANDETHVMQRVRQ